MLLELAGEVALSASTLELRGQSWTIHSSDAASLSAGLFRQSLEYSAVHDTTSLQAKLAWALAQSGHGGEALALAESIAARQKGSVEFLVNFARLACANGDAEAGLDSLERAMSRYGFSDVTFLESCPEFPKDNDRFRRLTSVTFEATSTEEKQAPEARVIMHSVTRQQKLKIELTYPTQQPVGALFTKKIFVRSLEPDTPLSVPFDRDALPARKKDGSVAEFGIKVVSEKGTIYQKKISAPEAPRSLNSTSDVAIASGGASEPGTSRPPGTAPATLPRIYLSKTANELQQRFSGLSRRLPPLARDFATLQGLAKTADETTDLAAREKAITALRKHAELMQDRASGIGGMAGQEMARTIGSFVRNLP